MTRDNAKCRKWEQERRIRLKEKFNELAKVLPSYDPSKSLCHINILEEAKKTIEELQDDLKTFLTQNKDKVKSVKDELIKKLQKRIKKLLTRNEELNNLLKNGSKPVGRAKRYKIPPELEKKLQQQEMEKENSFKWLQTKKKKKITTNNTSTAAKYQSTKKTTNSKKLSQNNNASSNCLLFIPPNNNITPNITPALNQPFYLITNPSPTATIKQPNVNLGLQHTPLITRSIPCINSAAPTLGPGTIVFSNGSVLPVLPQSLVQPPRTIISLQKNNGGINLPTVTTPKIITNTKSNNKIANMKKSNKTPNSEISIKKVQPITPLKKCVTNTTHVNKLPIPAVSTSYIPLLNNVPILNGAAGKITIPRKAQKLSRDALIMIHKRNATSKRKISNAASENNIIKKSKIGNETAKENSEINVTTALQEKSIDTCTTQLVKETEQIIPKMLNTVSRNTTDTHDVNKEEKTPQSTTLDDMISNDDKAKNEEMTNQQIQEKLPSSQHNGSSTNVLMVNSNTNILQDDLKNLELNLSHSELSNEIFATLQVPSGCQNPESTSPTAAFLLSFPLVSSFRGNDVTDEINNESQNDAQKLDNRHVSESKTTQNISDLNLDTFSFFSSKNVAEGFSGSFTPTPETCLDNSSKNTTVENEKTKILITKRMNDIVEETNAEENLTVKNHSSKKKNYKTERKEEQYNAEITIQASTKDPTKQFSDFTKDIVPASTLPASMNEHSDPNKTQTKSSNDIVVTSNNTNVSETKKAKTILIIDNVVVSEDSVIHISKKENFTKTAEMGSSLNENISQISSAISHSPVMTENKERNYPRPSNYNKHSKNMDSNKFDKGMDVSVNPIQKKQDNILWNLKSLAGFSEELGQGGQDQIVTTGKVTNLPNHSEKEHHNLLWASDMNLNTVEKQSETKSNCNQEKHVVSQKIDRFSYTPNSQTEKDQQKIVKNGMNDRNQSQVISLHIDKEKEILLWNSEIGINSSSNKISDSACNNKEVNSLHTSKLAETKYKSKNLVLQQSPKKEEASLCTFESLGNFEYLRENENEHKQIRTLENVISSSIQYGLSSVSNKDENPIVWNPEILLNTNNTKLPENTLFPKRDQNLCASSETKDQNEKKKQDELFLKQNSLIGTSNYKYLNENVYEQKHNKTAETVVNNVIQSDTLSHIEKEQTTLLWNPEFNVQKSNQKTLEKSLSPIKSLVNNDPNKNQTLHESQKKENVLHQNLKSEETGNYKKEIQCRQNQHITTEKVINDESDTSSKPGKNQNILLWNSELNVNSGDKQPSTLTHDHKYDNNSWNLKSLESSNPNKNQRSHQNTSLQSTFWNPQTKFQSVPEVVKRQNILGPLKSNVEINVNEKTKSLQPNINQETMLWNTDLNTIMNTTENQVYHNGKGHNYNATNTKSSGNIGTSPKFSEKETSLIYPLPSVENYQQQKTEINVWNSGLLSSEKAKNQEPHSNNIQNNFIWNPDSVITHDSNKKEIDQIKTDRNLWNRGLVATTKQEKTGNITKKGDTALLDPQLQKNTANVQKDPTQNQLNQKPESYLWHSKSVLTPVSTNHISNFVEQKSENNLWNIESRSKQQELSQLDKTQNTNVWLLDSVVAADINKTTSVQNDKKQDTKSIKNQNTPYLNMSQNTVSWKSSVDMEACKSQNKKHNINLINSQSVVASDSAQNKLELQSCAKENHQSWTPELLLGFDFHNRQSTIPWNPQLGDSKNNQSTDQSSKKTGNALWNPELIMATHTDKKQSPQMDKKQGSHLWNPESIVAIDVNKSQMLPSNSNSEKQCKNFWYPDSSIVPDAYKPQNIHTCSRYNSQLISQPTIQSLSNMHYTTACSKHKDTSNIENSVFQNLNSNNGNLWAPPYYSNSNKNQMFTNSKINDYNIGFNYHQNYEKNLEQTTKDKQNSHTWASNLNKINSAQRKTNENAIKNLPNSSDAKNNIDHNLQYNTQQYVQNPSTWPTNQFEKLNTLVSDEFKKPKEILCNNNKPSGNTVNAQNNFTMQYHLTPESNNGNIPNYSNNGNKKNIWNMQQSQDLNNYVYNIPQHSEIDKNTIVPIVDSTKKQNSLPGSLNIHSYNQTNIQNQDAWSVKEVQPVGHNQLYIQQEKTNQSKDKVQCNMEKPGSGIGLEFTVKDTLNSHEKRDVSYTLCKNKNASSNTNSSENKNLVFEQNVPVENKNTFDVTKAQIPTACNIFKKEDITVSKAVFEFDKTHTSNTHNFGLYMEPTIKNSKTDPSTSNYNTMIDKNKTLSTNANKGIHTSVSMNSLQNVNQANTDIAKQEDQKAQYYFSSIYPTVSTNMSFQNETPKIYSTSIYTNFNKDYSNPLYTNSVNYSHNVTDTTFNENYYKNKPVNYNSIQDPSSSSSKYYNIPNNSSRKHTTNKGKKLPSTKPVNWMTTPENKMQTVDSFLPICSTQSYSLSSCVVTTTEANSTIQPDNKKHVESITDDKQFCWSSSKYTNFIEPTANFVTPILPTLVGDLALGHSSFGEQKPSKDVKKKNSSENQVNFLSVSQLVDQNKTETTPAKIVTRRNSGGRSKVSTSTKTKRSNKKDISMEKCAQNKSSSNNHCFENPGTLNDQFYDKSRNPSKNVSSSYSAEALIGNQIINAGSKKYPEPSGKIQGNNFLSENLITYFPAVDENYMIPNQNFQTTNFSHGSFQNASYNTNNFIYTPSSTIASTYLPNTFEPTLPDYTTDNLNLAANKEKSPSNKYVKSLKEDKSHCSKKNKKKQTYDGGSSGFEYPFLPVPGSTNSPILPEDFHVHTNILSSSATPFSCKNNMYQKVPGDFNTNPLLPLGLPRNTIPQPEISPINSASTFTNFNLSSIFPEINKGATSNIFQ